MRFAEHCKPVTKAYIAEAKRMKKGEHVSSAVGAYCTDQYNGQFNVSLGVLSGDKNSAHRFALETNGVEMRNPSMNRVHDGVNIG